MGRHTDAYTTINDTRELSQDIGYLLRNVDVGTQEFTGTGNCVDDGQTTRTDESQMMTSHQGRTSQSHKSITQTNHTNESHKTK